MPRCGKQDWIRSELENKLKSINVVFGDEAVDAKVQIRKKIKTLQAKKKEAKNVGQSRMWRNGASPASDRRRRGGSRNKTRRKKEDGTPEQRGCNGSRISGGEKRQSHDREEGKKPPGVKLSLKTSEASD